MRIIYSIYLLSTDQDEMKTTIKSVLSKRSKKKKQINYTRSNGSKNKKKPSKQKHV